MAEPVDFPGFVFVFKRATGPHRGIEADFAEGAGVAVFAADGVGIMGHATAGDRGEGEPRRHRDGAFQAIVGVETGGALFRAGQVGAFLQVSKTRVEPVIKSGHDRRGQQIETNLGEPFLHAEKVIGIGAQESAEHVVVARVGAFEKGVGFLDREKPLGFEIAHDLGVAPVVELAVERETWAESLLVLPLNETPIFGNWRTENVVQPVAVIMDIAGAKKASGRTVGTGACIGGGRAEHHAAGAVESQIAAEFHAVGHGQLQAEFSKNAQTAAVADAGGEGGEQFRMEVV